MLLKKNVKNCLESKEEQSKGFKKVSVELKLATEENVSLAEKLRNITNQQEEIESLMNINEELKEVNETLENKICKLNIKLDRLQEKSIVPQKYDEDDNEDVEGMEAENLSLGLEGSPPPADDHSSIDHIIDNLQREISNSSGSSSVSVEEEEIHEEPRDAESSSTQRYRLKNRNQIMIE